MSCISTPLVSVLIPAYNACGSINATLLSIRQQKFSSIEVILIDDGSRVPLSFSLEFEFSDINLKLFRMPDNVGVANALNFGIMQCSGKYIARLDADDLMLKDRIRLQVNALESDICDVVYSQLLVENNKVSRLYVYPVSPSAIEFSMKYGNPVPHPGVMCSTKLLKHYRYVDIEKCRGMEDYYLWARMLKDGYRFIGLPEFGVKYSISNNQISRKVEKSSCLKKAMEKIAGILDSPEKKKREKYNPIFLFKKINSFPHKKDQLAASIIVSSSAKRNLSFAYPLDSICLLFTVLFLRLVFK